MYVGLYNSILTLKSRSSSDTSSSEHKGKHFSTHEKHWELKFKESSEGSFIHWQFFKQWLYSNPCQPIGYACSCISSNSHNCLCQRWKLYCTSL